MESSERRIAGVVLAAGASTRFGSAKQLAPLRGRPLLQHAVDAAAAGGLDEVVVVLGHESARVAAAITLPPGARAVVNPEHAQGQSTSLRTGIAAAGDADAVVVLLGDQPGVRPDAIAALVAARHAGGGPILQARYGGRPGHPVLLGREVLAEATAVEGDEGARALMRRDPARVVGVEVHGDPPGDVDAPEDLPRA